MAAIRIEMRTDMKTSSLKNLATRNASGGFTLIELLLVMAVLAVLSTLAVGVMASAQNDARAAATRSRVRIITSILEQEIEDYEVRRLPVDLQAIALVAFWQYGTDADYNTRVLLYQRNLSRRLRMDLIRNEMPNSSFDLFSNSANGFYPSETFVQAFDNRYLEGSPSGGRLTQLQRDGFLGELRRFAPANAIAWQNFTGDLPSEFLYEILSRIDYNGASALDAIGSQAVGDSDGDGLLEIVDGWDEPMEFVIQQKYLIERLDDVTGLLSEQWGENTPGTPFANTSFPLAEFTDLGRSLPNVAGDLRVLVTSEKLREIDYSIDGFSAFPGPKPEDYEPTVDPTIADPDDRIIASPDFISTVTFPSF